MEGLKPWIVLYLKGCAMGAADAVPGISGGTIAFITGIYSRLIQALTSLSFSMVLENFRGLTLDEESKFLGVLGLGIVSAVFLTLNLVDFMIANFLTVTYAFFFGVIAASIPVVGRKTGLTFQTAASGLLGFILAFAVSGLSSAALTPQMHFIFLSGFLSVTAMVLPGISGSLILLILGQYEYMTGTVSRFTSAAAQQSTETLLQSGLTLTVFIAGALAGLFTSAEIVKKALEYSRELTMAFLIGMIAGSLRAPILRISSHLSEKGLSWINVLPEFMVAGLIGGAAVLILNRLSQR
ncbi:MAG: DUF368 domain-containing protein [Candidatus Nanohaloarchaea archaeon]